MGGSDSNCEASGESSRLLSKEDESLAMGSLLSGSISRQCPESRPSTSTQNVPLKEERIEVGIDLMGFRGSQRLSPRIFEVADRGDFETLCNLLTKSTTEVNTIDSKGNTALHYAVASACRKGDGDGSFYQSIDLLMSCKQMNVNMPNKKGYTAIGYALNALHRTCIEHMLRHPSADRLHLDYYPGDRESTVREIILDIYPDLQPLLPAYLMESLDSTDRDIKLLAALQRDEYNIFNENLSPTNPNPWYGEPYHSSLLEIACQKKNHKEFVEILLEKGADPNIKNHITGMPLLHATARSGNFEVLQLFLEKGGIDASHKDNKKRTVFHWLAGVSERNPGDKEKIEECIKHLLGSNNILKDIDDRDSLGKTPLYITVERGFRDRAKLLLSEGADVRVCENSITILSTSVSIVKEILDDCLQSNDKPLTSMDLQLKLNYKSLMNIVSRIVESGLHRDLLTHPVLSTFLTIRWENVRFIYFLDLAFYLTFLCLLTAYILYSEPYNTLNDGGAASNTTDTFSSNDSNITSGINDSNFTSQPNRSSLPFLDVFLMISLCLLILREIAQLIATRWVYVKSLEHWLVILLIISTFISCSGVVESAELKLHFSIVTLFLGWFELLMLLGRLPRLSVKHEMLKTVTKTFLIFTVSNLPLLIAFALCFFLIFRGSSEQSGAEMFDDPLSLFEKTLAVSSGKLQYSHPSFLTVPLTFHMIYALFFFSVSIVLVNLLSSLAAGHTDAVKQSAETLVLVARAKLIYRIERLVNALPQCMKPRIEQKEEMFVIYPNRPNIIGSAAVRSLIDIISKKRSIMWTINRPEFNGSGACSQTICPSCKLHRKIFRKI